MAHASAIERFTDSGLHVVPWTAELAVRVAGAATLEGQAREDAIRRAIDDDRLPAAAVDALVVAGLLDE